MRASSVRVLSEARADHVTRLAASDRWRELLARLSLDASEHASLVLGRRLVAPARARRPCVDPAEAPPLLTPVRHVSLLFVMRVRAGWVHPSARRRARASRLLLRVMASDLCGAGERHPQLYLGPSSGSPAWRPVAPVMPVAAASHPPRRRTRPVVHSGARFSVAWLTLLRVAEAIDAVVVRCPPPGVAVTLRPRPLVMTGVDQLGREAGW